MTMTAICSPSAESCPVRTAYERPVGASVFFWTSWMSTFCSGIISWSER
ncbi:hypothetical protein STSP_00010 [Streptomyces jeddahensis]|uniref:Uncharacterized protein n=1 Tax=Streptomyces jeddahensis TaxID=1716141 RepID=A0A177I1C3_9ACTN|nr:hypothetical protein STSP_00010 [Streptomyces jeddahensis]